MSGLVRDASTVLITDELARRPGVRQLERERDVLIELVRAVADNADSAFDVLVARACELCNAGSAGITLIDRDAGGIRGLQWVTVAGALAAHTGLRVERNALSAALALDRAVPQLLRDPARAFPALEHVAPRIVEHLLVPIVAAGEMVGILWTATHDTRQFTAAHAAMLESLAAVAAAALRARRAEAAAREGERMLATVVEHAPVGIYVCDAPSATIRFYNQHAAAMWGREPRLDDPRDQFCGSVRMFGSDGSALPHEECPMAQALAGQVLEGMEVQIERPDGTRAWALVNVAPVHDDGAIVGAVNVFIDITALKTAHEALRRSEEQLNDFFEHGTIGLHWVGADGTILRANRAELDMLGYSCEEYVGRSIIDFHADRETIDDILRRLHAGEEIRNYPARMRARDGSIRHVLINSSVMRRDGHFVHTRCFTRDVTDLRRIEEERELLLAREQEARAAAEMANRAKDEFLAMLGHELRNPLGVITSAVGVLERVGSPEPAAFSARTAIRRHAGHLAAIVDDLLDVARVTLGKIFLKRERLDLGQAVMHWVGTFRAAGGAEQRDLTADVETVWVDADPTRIDQIVSNLVGNALKFTPPGGHVRLTVKRSAAEAVLEVIDDGAGISADLLPRVFDLFAQGDRTLDRPEGGLGLGLTLVRHLATMHGGRVEAASDGRGHGSRFTVRLPVMDAVVEAPPAERAAPRPTPRRRVLIVEDNDDAREMLTVLLQLDGHDIDEARDGHGALARAAIRPPDVVIMDVGLPGMDGYEVAQRLRAAAERPIRLVALTGYGQPEDRRRALDAGFDGHLVKPVDPDRLRRELAP